MDDLTFMRRALELAEAMKGLTGENPSVGCVIVKDGMILGEAATAAGGRPHAEEQALDIAGASARGATVYVTLEPCAQRSSGAPSCSELLTRAGVARVVASIDDPHVYARGNGFARLRAAGAVVDVGLEAEAAQAINAEFLARAAQSD